MAYLSSPEAAASLREVVEHAYRHAPAVRERFARAGLSPQAIQAPDDLAHLPVLRKDELPARQAAGLPFGGLLGTGVTRLERIFMSPGPIYDPQAPGPDPWRMRPSLQAAGFAAGDLVINTFSYHFSPAGFMFDKPLTAMSCVVIPAGVGNQELAVRAMNDLGVTGYVGVPSYLLALLHKANEMGLRVPGALALKKAFVTAEMLPETLRRSLTEEYGIQVTQGYGTADVGAIAHECGERAGMHLDAGIIVELLDPATGRPVPPGEMGEVVVTLLDPTYPLLRFGTGDLSRLLPGACPCGDPAPRLAGVLGRVGEAVKVRGMFVHPRQLDEVVRPFSVSRWQAVVTQVDGVDELRLLVEPAEGRDWEAGAPARLTERARSELRVRIAVEVVAPGSIAADAKRIDDRRRWK